MKMVFQVAEPEMLDDLSEGQSIRFAVDRVAGKLTITEILE
ncbi:copper-binding protein [Paracoccus marcusii]|nr:copper-binding protein [Paracoccus marcusii]